MTDKPKRDPESDFFDTLKRKDVFILTCNGDYRGTLLWVSKYSLGLSIEGTKILIMKSSVEAIYLSEEDSVPDLLPAGTASA